jgi:hypothetical protein
MFLTKQELEELTGYKYSSKQANWLRMRGYKHEIGRNGSPKVLRAHIEEVLGLKNITTHSSRRSAKPDFSALAQFSVNHA